jgi:hypothetical protein
MTWIGGNTFEMKVCKSIGALTSEETRNEKLRISSYLPVFGCFYNLNREVLTIRGDTHSCMGRNAHLVYID